MSDLNLVATASLLASHDTVFRDVGLQQLLRGLPDSAALATRFLAKADEPVADWLLDNLRRYCPFLRPGYSDPVTNLSGGYALFDDLHKELESFLLAVRSTIQECTEGERVVLLRRLAGLPGIAADVREMVRQIEGNEGADRFASVARTERSKLAERQLMIFLSYACNLSCPYCFAKGKHGDMPLAKAIELIGWAQHSGARVVTFLGGEPTIYPEFSMLLDELARRGLHSYLATNLLADPDLIRKMHNDVMKLLIVHVAHKHVYLAGQWDQLAANLQTVLAQNIPVTLRVNAYAPGHDWAHLFELTDRFRLKDVQFALAFPASNAANVFVEKAHLARMIPEVLEMQRQCDERGLRMSMSKPLPVCLFPEQAQQRMLRQPGYQSSCNVSNDGYTQNVCALPSGDIAPCQALLDATRPQSELHDWVSLAAYCESKLRPLMEAPLFEACSGCFLFARRLCQGACVGHKTGSA